MTPQRWFFCRRKVEKGELAWLAPNWCVVKEKNIFGHDHYILRNFTGYSHNPLSCFADWEQVVAVVKELKI